MATGVYKTTKKDGSVYYRVSITYKNKHISIGSYDDELTAASTYTTAVNIINNSDNYSIDTDFHTTTYKKYCPVFFPFDKFISLINYRDNGIYIKTPIYLCNKFFLYFISADVVLTFSNDDLFYYSHHTIMRRGGYYFVNDYGMQTSILTRFGVRNHSVKGKDYIFKNGDEHDYRYENIYVINQYNGVSMIKKNGQIMYQSRIHINGDFIIGTYASEYEAAIAYNKTADMLYNISTVNYNQNYIQDISAIEYASIYNKVKVSKRILSYIQNYSS